jgi:hypothetical protein
MNDFLIIIKVPQGHRPLRPTPDECGGYILPDHLWDLIQACWAPDPKVRPDISEVKAQLEWYRVSGFKGLIPPPPASVAHRTMSLPRFRNTSGLNPHDEDLTEEKIRLLLDSKLLDKDVLEGLIKGLKIPAASNTNPPNIKLILFPGNLIRLVTNEMWKYGLISESERFLANVMQTILDHVMVYFIHYPGTLSHERASLSQEKTRLHPASFGFLMFTRCCLSSV